MSGCPAEAAWADACCEGDVSQQPMCPHWAHRRRCTHHPLASSHSTHPVPLGGTEGSIPAISLIQLSLVTGLPAPCGAAAVSFGAVSGSHTWKRVSPGDDSRLISPWCLLTMMRKLRSSPKPVPSPTGLVVKNGSHIRAFISRGPP